jgi:hypothetical protein
MATFHNGYENIKVTIVNWPGNDIAKNVYEFGRLSHDFYIPLVEKYDEQNPDCQKLIDKIVEGTTLPKFALNQRIEFRIENITRICLAQLTRDSAIFASASTGVFPMSQDFNIPMNIYADKSIMSKLEQAQKLLEEAYIEACEKEYPTIESRYIGLHPQTISLTASYTFTDFVRSCYSRTSSNFCDECNYVYRLMYRALMEGILKEVNDENSIKLYNWLIPEHKCINDSTYKRERLYNSDFTWDKTYTPKLPALNDWRKSGWKEELERMYANGTGWLTEKEVQYIEEWLVLENYGDGLPTTYDNTKPDVAVNMIKTMPYYKEHKNG